MCVYVWIVKLCNFSLKPKLICKFSAAATACLLFFYPSSSLALSPFLLFRFLCLRMYIFSYVLNTFSHYFFLRGKWFVFDSLWLDFKLGWWCGSGRFAYSILNHIHLITVLFLCFLYFTLCKLVWMRMRMCKNGGKHLIALIKAAY